MSWIMHSDKYQLLSWLCKWLTSNEAGTAMRGNSQSRAFVWPSVYTQTHDHCLVWLWRNASVYNILKTAILVHAGHADKVDKTFEPKIPNHENYKLTNDWIKWLIIFIINWKKPVNPACPTRKIDVITNHKACLCNNSPWLCKPMRWKHK